MEYGILAKPIENRHYGHITVTDQFIGCEGNDIDIVFMFLGDGKQCNFIYMVIPTQLFPTNSKSWSRLGNMYSWYEQCQSLNWQGICIRFTQSIGTRRNK